MRLITYYPNDSLSIGGVQTLIRELNEMVDKLDGFHYELIDYRDEKLCLNSSPYTSMKVFLSENKPTLSFRHKILRRLRVRKKLLEIFNKEDVGNTNIIIFNTKDLFFIPRFMFENSKVILVQTTKTDKFYGSKIASLAVNLYKKRIKYFTTYTSFDYEEIIKKFSGIDEKIRIIPRGCKIVSSPSIAVFNKKLVTIARIEERTKNFTDMVDIFKTLPIGFTLDIYGFGSERELDALTLLIKDVKGIKYCGPAKDIAETLKGYSLFLLTSHYEGYCQSVVEARSQGVPVVAYDTFPAAKWVIKNKETGYLIEYKDKVDYANKILDICFSQELHTYLSMSSLKYAVETEKNKINILWENILMDDKPD